jgi:hypothetical protein
MRRFLPLDGFSVFSGLSELAKSNIEIPTG